MKRTFKIIVCLTLAAGLCTTATAANATVYAPYVTSSLYSGTKPAAANLEKAEAPDEKTEMVYVNLNADGTPREKIVTDRLHSDHTDAVIADDSALSDIYPIKGGQLVSEENGKLTWKLEGNDLYYRGNSNLTLPLDVSIRYSLDGTEYQPRELAGRSGHLVIDLDLRNNRPRTVQIDGHSKTMYTPVSAVIGIIMPDDIFRNITVTDGTVVGDGSRFIVGITAMPGLSESLALTGTSIPEVDKIDFPEHFTVTADVTGFEMEPIAIAATTGFPDKNISTQFTDDMYKNLSDLQDMQSKLETMDGDRQIRSLFTNSKNRETTQTLINDIYDFYALDTDIVDVFNCIVTPRNLDLMDDILGELEWLDNNGLLTSSTTTGLLKLAAGDSVDNLFAMLGDLEAAGEQLEPVLPMASDEGIELMGGLAAGAEQLPQLMQAYSAAFGGMSDEQLALFVQAGMAAVYPNAEASISSPGASSIGAGASGVYRPEQAAYVTHTHAVNPQSVQAGVGFLKGMKKVSGMMTAAESASPEVKQALAAGAQLLSNPAQLKGLRNKLAYDLQLNAPAFDILMTEIEPVQLKQLGAIPAMFADELKQITALKKRVDPLLDEYDLTKVKNNAPHTLSVLTRIKHDLENNRDISDTLKKATSSRNSNTFADIIATLDRLEADGAVDSYVQQVNDLRSLIQRANTVSTLAEPDVNYIMKTDGVKLPEPEPILVEAPPEETGFLAKLTEKFKK